MALPPQRYASDDNDDAFRCWFLCVLKKYYNILYDFFKRLLFSKSLMTLLANTELSRDKCKILKRLSFSIRSHVIKRYGSYFRSENSFALCLALPCLNLTRIVF